jgi:S1-C subfamily serine protease
MQVEHVIVSSEEITEIEAIGEPPFSLFDREYAGVPKWALVACSPLVAMLPLLCLLVVVARVVLRHRPLAVRQAWLGFFSTLLIVSGVLSSAAAVAFLSLPRMPTVLSTNIPDFDERDAYPHLPLWTSLDSSEVSIELKPLVIIVSRMNRMWPVQSSPPVEFGAGVLLLANQQGYLFATAKHLVWSHGSVPRQALISTASGMRASADVVATGVSADLALLWMNRRSGNAVFTQPIGEVTDGEPVFVIGHPEGLNYTLSTGIVSGLRGTDVQITAAISPGNSGGPVYDIHGNLVGIVSSKFDQNRDANAENLGFATAGNLLRKNAGWQFAGDGELRLQQYIQALDRQ